MELTRDGDIHGSARKATKWLLFNQLKQQLIYQILVETVGVAYTGAGGLLVTAKEKAPDFRQGLQFFGGDGVSHIIV